MNEKKQITFIAETKAIDAEKGIFEAMISTEAEDREGDIVVASGARTENFMKNPVVMFAHDYRNPPVAKALSLEIMAGRGIKSQFQFPEWETYEQADIVRRLWAGGFLNAVSIGFMPKSTPKPREEGASSSPFYNGYIYDDWELLEYSIVPVPANQDALRLAVKSMGAIGRMAVDLASFNNPDPTQVQEKLRSELVVATMPRPKALANEEPPAQPTQETTPEEGDAPSDNAESEAEPITAAALNDESDAEFDAALDQLESLLPEIKEVLI